MTGHKKPRGTFNRSAVAHREEDISGVRAMIAEWRSRGVSDVRAYLEANPRELRRAIDSIRLLDVNDAALELYEARTREDLLGSLDATLDAGAIGGFKELIVAIADGRTKFEVESTTRTLRGKRLDLIARMFIPPPGDDSPTMLVAVLDITGRKRAEEALSRERAFLSILMDAIPDYIYFKDLQSRFILTNRAHARAFGLDSPAEAAGKTDFDFNTEESARVSFDDEQRIIATGRPIIDVVEKETWPDRPDTWVSTTKMPFRDAEGNTIGTFGISRDVTERRRAEERNIRLATLVESSPDAIVGLDLERRVTSWNKGAERIYGYSAEEAMGQHASLFMPPEVEEEALALRNKVVQGESVSSFETLRRRKDGSLMNVSLVLSPIRDADGHVVGTASIARDISAQKALQAQNMRAQRLESLSILAGGVAHQFNNANMVIKGYLDILLQSEPLSDPARTYLQEAMAGVQRAVDITDRLQGLAGSKQAKTERVRMNDVVRTLLPLFENRIQELGATVNLELRECAPLTIDQSQLGFIVTSLVTNSLDALVGQARREITLRTGSRGHDSFLEVADSGCGIPAGDMARIFTPFFTTKGEWAPAGSPQVQVKGVGLSLAVCHSTVSERGGRIEVESDLEMGALFRVLLPAES
jgi:PAS domain S-box-containing protein